MPKVVRFHNYGGPEVLRLEESPAAQPGAGEVLIEVHAIGLNRAESMFRSGAYLEAATFPSRLGYEAAGVVLETGEGVDAFAVGDHVSLVPPSSIARWGSYAEQTVVPAAMLVKHPSRLNMQQAAAVWMQYLTAWGALLPIGKLSRHDTVLITAASSSVGLAAIQIARRTGARSIAFTRSPNKVQALLNAGACHVVVGEEELTVEIKRLTAGNGVRLIFDPVGGALMQTLVNVASRGGMLISYGALAEESTPYPLLPVLAKSLTLRGYLLHEIIDDSQLFAEAKRYVIEGIEEGSLLPYIDSKTFNLDEIVDAHRYMESGKQLGKIVINTRLGK